MMRLRPASFQRRRCEQEHVMRASSILDPALEQQDPIARRAYLGTRLRETVAWAHSRSPHVRRAFDKAGIGPRDVASLDDLTKIPITRKDDVPAMQAAEPPFGGLLAVEPARLQRIFASPGPILDPQGEGDDFWRFRMALAAAGFRRGDIAINSASYHLTPLGFMLDNAARSLGCVVVPAGVGQTDVQVRVASALRATCYLGTPSFLYALVKRGREMGMPLPIEVAFVKAGMFPRGAEIAKALEGFPAVARFQAVVTRDQHQDRLAYVVELAEGAAPEAGLSDRIADTMREAMKVRGEVRISPRGTLPEGSKRIDDRRTWR